MAKATALANQKRKPRLLWANSFCLLDTSSGASMTVRQMLHQLVAKGYEVKVLGATIFDNPKGMSKLKEQYPNIHANLHQLIEAEDGPLTHQLLVTYSTNRNHLTTHESSLWHSQYTYLLDHFKPDVVWFYGGQTLDMLIPDEARDRGIPTAFYLANGSYKATRWCRDIDLVLTDSQATADMYRKAAGFAAKPIGKFIDQAMFVAEHHERKRLLYINPSWAKGASIVVQLALQLERERPDIEIEVVEARADWSEVLCETSEKLGKKRDTLSNVIITPNTSDMREPYSHARVLLAPSLWWESSGRVLAEAMLNGIPALITKRGGMPEMVEDAGVAFDFPKECYEEPYQYLLSDKELQPLLDAVINFYDDEVLYQSYVERAKQVGEKKHHLDKATQRLVNAFAPLVNQRAGNKEFTISQRKRHRQNLASVSGKPKFTVDASFLKMVQSKINNAGIPTTQVTLPDFDWQISGKVIVLDNRAKLIKSGAADKLAALGAFGIVAFDPASEVADPKQYDDSETIQVFQHALLGDGKPGTLYTCLVPEMSSTLAPLPELKLPKHRRQSTKVLTKLPINTIALDSIKGLGRLDWLILDDLSDAETILNNGQETLKDTLLIQARVAFQPTHEKQPSLAELQHWASRNGFRFYRFNDIKHHSYLPSDINIKERQATEQESADVLFLPSQERMDALSKEQKLKLAFVLSTVFEANDIAYSLLSLIEEEQANKFLIAIGVKGAVASFPSYEAKKSIKPINIVLLKEKLSEVLSYLAIFHLTQDFAFKVVEVADQLRCAHDVDFIESAIAKIAKEFSKNPNSIPLFYLLTHCLLNRISKEVIDEDSLFLKNRLNLIGWGHKISLYSWWLKTIQDYRLSAVTKKFTVVVICNKYKKETYENLIELRQQCGNEGEIIFVNNGDHSSKAISLETYADVYIELKDNSGAYLARNIGAAFAAGEILIFVDDDGFPENGMLEAHSIIHQKYRLDAVRGSYLPKNPNEIPPSHYHLGDKALVAMNCLEGNCSYRADTFFKMDGWGDYILFGHGGAELYVRMLANGSDRAKHIYIPNCVLRHDYYRGEKHAKSKKKKQTESAYLLSAKNNDIDPMVSGFLRKRKKASYISEREQRKKVCIGIPVYNEEKYIGQTIDSLKKQDYEDVVFVVSDNASTDRSLEIVKEKVKGDDRFVVVSHKENVGASSNFEFLYKQSNSEYFMWLGGHDYISKEYVRRSVEFLDSHLDFSMVFGMPYGVLENTDKLSFLKEGVYNFLESSPVDRYLSSVTSLSNCTILHSMFRSECLKGFEFRKTISFDHVLISRLLWFGKLYYLNDEKYFRRYFDKRKESQSERILGYSGVLERKDFFKYYVDDISLLYSATEDKFPVQLKITIDRMLKGLFVKYGRSDSL